jgi:hypothetical protein
MNSNIYDIIISIVVLALTVYFVRGILKDSQERINELNDRRKQREG